jgi:cAMP-specific phosphodiesterase 4
LALETLDELDWCLDQLETIQTHRSVSDMATSKFKRMLNKELSHFSESSRSGNQISEYIFSTFVDKNQEVDIPSLRVDDEEETLKYSAVERKFLHNHSLSNTDKIPKFAVETTDEAALGHVCSIINAHSSSIILTTINLLQLLEDVDKWGIDIFRLEELTQHRPLTATAYSIFQVFMSDSRPDRRLARSEDAVVATTASTMH